MKALISFILLLTLNSSLSWAFPTDFLEKIFTKIKIFKHSRGLSAIEKQILERATFKKVNGKIVAQRSIFDPCAKDSLGRTNLQRMLKGLAPIGYDGKPVELHHLKQENNGIIVEMLSTEHKQYYRDLHRYKKDSEINRIDFIKWKIQYWKLRAKDFKRCVK